LIFKKLVEKMLTAKSIRVWTWLHKWSSLICTIFMLMLCLTGLPLIFQHQINEWLGREVDAPAHAPGTRLADMDRVMAVAYARHPNKVAMFVSREADDDKVWYITMGDTATATDLVQVAVDSRSAKMLAEPKIGGEGFMAVMLSLHVDLFAGLPGKLFLGFMGLLFLLALLSGVVLYAPFMRKLNFGDVRRRQSARIKWLDLHNLLGIVSLTWALVVGGTGVINTWAELLVKYWQSDQMAAMVAPYRGLPPINKLGSLETAVVAAKKLEPNMNVGFIAFPGTSFSSPHHYGVFMRGTAPVTSKLFKPVLVDAERGTITDSRTLPWYLTALLLSQPLHFGDYGGMPMQILWAVLDIITIIVLGSGLYLWVKRRRRAPETFIDATESLSALEHAQ
jgi:uncharacterized iron-regulated membrane protein